MNLSSQKQILKILFLLFVTLWLIAFFQKDKLPNKDQMLSSQLQEPFQSETSMEPFSVRVKGETYKINPVFNYELYGLVVSDHLSSSWIDISHEKAKDYLNVEDLCVVYGENISSGIYSSLKFSSGDWTCYVNWTGSMQQQIQESQQFKGHYLSNNHILTEDPVLVKRILSTNKGDQIYFKGYLVNYTNERVWNSFYRKSSTTRDDVGGTACEVIYATDFQILKKANVFWRFIYTFSKWMIVVLIFLFLAISYYEAGKLLETNP